MERREDKTARGSKKNKGKQKYIATEDMFLHDNNNFWKKKKQKKGKNPPPTYTNTMRC